MEIKRRLKIRYIERFVEEDGIKLPVNKIYDVTTSHTKRYHNTLYLLANLQGCARNLMDYFTEIMDGDNNVSTNKGVIDKFVADMKSLNISYCKSTTDKAIRTLKEKNFIILVTRAYYQVNPAYFMKNNDSKREELIRINLEFKRDTDFTNIEVE